MNNGSLSPKVTWPLFVGLFLSSVLTNFALITPDMLSWLGPWAPFAYGTVFSLLGFAVGYFKSDPVRDLGVQAAAKPDLGPWMGDGHGIGPNGTTSSASAAPAPRILQRDAAAVPAAPVAPVPPLPDAGPGA